MAIRPQVVYPGQTISGDAGYPHGKARNQLVENDGTGTPLEELWVNDLFGMQQALLNDAAVTPSGTPDTVSASDYLNSLKTLFIYGKAGGTWTPSAPIIVAGGAGLRLSAPFSVDAGQTADFNGFVTFDGVVTFNGPSLTFNQQATFDAGFIVTAGDVEFDDDVLFTAPVVLQSTVQVDGQLDANGGLVVFGGALVAGGMILSGVSQLSGDGRFRQRVTTAANIDLTVGVDTADIVYLPASTLSAPRQWTITDTGAGNGDQIFLTRRRDTSGHNITVVRQSDAATLITLPGTTPRCARLLFVGGQWECVDQSS
jgi:phage baseplate assembly protein gpV